MPRYHKTYWRDIPQGATVQDCGTHFRFKGDIVVWHETEQKQAEEFLKKLIKPIDTSDKLDA